MCFPVNFAKVLRTPRIEHSVGYFWLSLIQVWMYTQLEMPQYERCTFYLLNNRRFNLLLNNWELINLQCFKL